MALKTVGKPFKTEAEAVQFVNVLHQLPKGAQVLFTDAKGERHLGAFNKVDDNNPDSVVVLALGPDNGIAAYRVAMSDIALLVEAPEDTPAAEEAAPAEAPTEALVEDAQPAENA